MTATALRAPASAPAPAPEAAERPSLGRLTAVELRKMVDTRAGLWLLLTIAALTVVAVVVVVIVGDPPDHTFRQLLNVAVQPSALLLPVAGILLVTSEWSQGTALITFALTPRRMRVLGAKLAAGAVLGLAALVLCILIAAIATLVAAADIDARWSMPAGLLVQDAVYLVTAIAGGIGFGAVLLASAPAIVVYFVLPTAWAAAGSLSFLEDAAEWLDGTRTMDTFAEEVQSADQWARVAATLALWCAVPLLIGAWRIARDEINSA